MVKALKAILSKQYRMVIMWHDSHKILVLAAHTQWTHTVIQVILVNEVQALKTILSARTGVLNNLQINQNKQQTNNEKWYRIKKLKIHYASNVLTLLFVLQNKNDQACKICYKSF